MIVFIDETGISERPTRVRTWAPKGQTPIIQFHFNWNHVSAIAGLSRTNYLFRLYEGSVKKEQVVEFLKALKAHLKQPLLIIWDGARPHHAAPRLSDAGPRAAAATRRSRGPHAEQRRPAAPLRSPSGT